MRLAVREPQATIALLYLTQLTSLAYFGLKNALCSCDIRFKCLSYEEVESVILMPCNLATSQRKQPPGAVLSSYWRRRGRTVHNLTSQSRHLKWAIVGSVEEKEKKLVDGI